MQKKIKDLYALEDNSPFLGHLIVLTALVPYVLEDGPPLVAELYQKSWDALPEELIQEFCDMNGIVV